MPSFSLGIHSKALIFTNAGPEVSPAATAPPSRVPLPPTAPSWCLPSPCGGTQSGSRPRHRFILLWMLLPGLIPELVTSGISFMFLHKKLCSSCWILFAGLGLLACFGEKHTQAYLSFRLSINTGGVRRMHIRACEQILTSSCFCLFLAISTVLL